MEMGYILVLRWTESNIFDHMDMHFSSKCRNGSDDIVWHACAFDSVRLFFDVDNSIKLRLVLLVH